MGISDRAQKAADTRAKNAELAQREAEKLARETEGGRGAKNKALENPVWKTNKSYGQRRQVDKDGREDRHMQEERSSKGKGKRRKKRADESDEDEEDNPAKKQRKHHSQRPPPAASIPNNTESDDQEDTAASSKHSSKAYSVKKSKSDAIAIRKDKKTERSLSSSNDQSSDLEEDKDSKSSSSSEDSDGEDIDNEGLQSELPQFIGADNEESLEFSPADNLFDIADEDVHMASRPSSRMSSRSTRPGTAPPTSDFESPSEDSEHVAPKKAVVKGRCAANFAAEVPVVKTSSRSSQEKKKRGKAAVVEEDSKWSPRASLILPASGKPSELNLRDQNPLIQSIIRKAIQKVTDEMVLKQAWPEAKERLVYEKAILVDACRDILKDFEDEDHSDVDAVNRRIRKDPIFAKALANVAIDRLSTLRAPAKREGEKHVPYYQLGLGKDCEERVESLFVHHGYIFPGSWGSGDSRNTWQPKRNEPYLNAAIVETLKAAFFSKPSSLGNQYLDRFQSSLPDTPDEHELPISLVALGSTGVYSSLYEFTSGFHKEQTFTGNSFVKAYAAHVGSLEKLKTNKPTQFHEIMSKLYKLVVSLSHDVGNDDANDIFSIIDL